METIVTKLRQASQQDAIVNLSRGIIHDINNKLSTVLGLAELAKMGLDGGADVENDLNDIRKAALGARELVDQLHAGVRHAGIRKMPIAVAPFIKAAMKFITALLPAAVEIRFLSADHPGKIAADLVQFHQLLVILCVNAAHALNKQAGRIGIRLQHVRFDGSIALQDSALKPGRYLQLCIGDTPIEISGKEEACAELIAGPAAAGHGAFPGLSLVRDMAGKMGGAVSVCSGSETGAVFKVVFPEHETASDEVSNGAIIDY